MISCNKGNTNFEGDEMELIADLGAIMYDLLNAREITVANILSALSAVLEFDLDDTEVEQDGV